MKPNKFILIMLIVITISFLNGCSPTPMDICGGGKIFTSYRGSKEAGWVSTNGHDDVQDVKTERPFDNPVFSPDGRKVAYRELVNNVNILDLETGNSEALIDGLDSTATIAAWSPDSKEILLSFGNEIHFYAYAIDTEKKIPHQLSVKDTVEFSQDWSKDGQYIVLVVAEHQDQSSDLSPEKSVVIERTDGTDRKVVLRDKHISHVKFLPDPQRIFIVSGSPSGVYLFDWKRNQKIGLPGLPENAHNYALSPNGKCIAYLPKENQEPYTEIPIYVLNNKSIFTVPVPGHHYYDLTWGK